MKKIKFKTCLGVKLVVSEMNKCKTKWDDDTLLYSESGVTKLNVRNLIKP